jgi:hypothetical protein
VLWRLLEGSRLLVPLGAVGSQRLQALRAALGVEPREWDGRSFLRLYHQFNYPTSGRSLLRVVSHLLRQWKRADCLPLMS